MERWGSGTVGRTDRAVCISGPVGGGWRERVGRRGAERRGGTGGWWHGAVVGASGPGQKEKKKGGQYQGGCPHWGNARTQPGTHRGQAPHPRASTAASGGQGNPYVHHRATAAARLEKQHTQQQRTRCTAVLPRPPPLDPHQLQRPRRSGRQQNMRIAARRSSNPWSTGTEPPHHAGATASAAAAAKTSTAATRPSPPSRPPMHPRATDHVGGVTPWSHG